MSDVATTRTRLIVLDGLRYRLDHSDAKRVAMGVEPETPADLLESLDGIAEGLRSQISREGDPQHHQVRALAAACVRWLETNDPESQPQPP